MSQRGRSRSGRPTPGGRPDRRGAGSEPGSRRSRRTRTTAPTTTADPSAEPDHTDSADRAAAAKPEHTFLGLSTGRAVVLGVVICALALTLAVPLRTYLTQQSEADRLAAEQVDLERQLTDLQRRKEQIDDPAWIAAQGRERLGLVRPGETPYKVQLPGDYRPPQKDAPPPPPSTGAWHSDLWQKLTGPLPGNTPQPSEPGVPTG